MPMERFQSGIKNIEQSVDVIEGETFWVEVKKTPVLLKSPAFYKFFNLKNYTAVTFSAFGPFSP